MAFLLKLAEPWGYVLIGLLGAAESSAFVGLAIPGETVMMLGGVLVFFGRADLGWMLLAGCLGAVAGDSIGYEIGRFLGPRLMRGRLGRKVGEARWQRAQGYVRRRGGRAVFLGRFVGVLRALVPAIAGSVEMPYRTFLLYNAAGGILWASAFILLGVAFGRSWRLVERWAGRASLVLLAVIALTVGVLLAARWVATHRDSVLRLGARILSSAPVAFVKRRFAPQLAFLRRRLDPRQRFGLQLSAGLALALGGAWAFGALLEDVFGREGVAGLDRPVLRFLVDHRSPALTGVMKMIAALGSAPIVASVLTAALVWVLLRPGRSLRLAVFLGATAGVEGLTELVRALVDRARPDVVPLVTASGDAFPSGQAAAATAMFAALAYVLARGTSWRGATWLWAGAAIASFLVAVSGVYLGVHWPTDALGGLALGGSWTAVTATAARFLPDRPFRSRVSKRAEVQA